MIRRRPILVVVLLAALLAALPATSAFAQSAGDDQYQNPLGGNSGSSGKSSRPSTPSRPAQSAPATSAPAAPAHTPRATRSVPLARTGFDAWIPAAAGLVLLAGGTLLLRTRHSPNRNPARTS